MSHRSLGISCNTDKGVVTISSGIKNVLGVNPPLFSSFSFPFDIVQILAAFLRKINYI